MTTWTQEYLTMIEDCEKRDSRLTDWERGFLDSITQRLSDDKPLSEKQVETLESIWERVTAKG